MFGQHSRWGAELAMAEANAKGGVLGRKIEIDFQDNRCNPAEAVKSVTQMLAEKKYVAIFDGLCSSAALAIMPLVERAGIPFVVANASATSIAEKSGVGGNKWTFKVNPTDASMLDALVGWLDKEGKAGNIAFLGEDTDFGRAGSTGLENALKKRNLKLAVVDFFQKGNADFTPVLTKIKAKKPGLLALYAVDADFQNAIRQWYGLGGGVPLTGRVLVDQVPKEIMESGFLDGTTSVQPYDPSVDTPGNKAFVEAFTEASQRAADPRELRVLRGDEDADRRHPARGQRPIPRPSATRSPPPRCQSMLGTVIDFDDQQSRPQQRDHSHHQGRQGGGPGHEQDLKGSGRRLLPPAPAERHRDRRHLRAGRHGALADLRRPRDRQLRPRRVLHAGRHARLFPDHEHGPRLLGHGRGGDGVAVALGYVLYEALLASLEGERLRAQHPPHPRPLHGAAERRGVPLHHHAPDGRRPPRATSIIVVGDLRVSAHAGVRAGPGPRSPSAPST